MSLILSSCGSTVVGQFTHIPQFEGSNQSGNYTFSEKIPDKMIQGRYRYVNIKGILLGNKTVNDANVNGPVGAAQ